MKCHSSPTTVPILASLSAVGFVATLYMVFHYAPFEPTLLFNQKIFYYHVAHAFMMFASVATCGVCSLVYLKKRTPKWDDIALASAEVAITKDGQALATRSFPDGSVCVDLPAGPVGDGYLVVDVNNGQAKGPLRAHLYDLGDSFELAGIERPEEGD